MILATVRAAVDAGINLLDMAPRYGDGKAELIVGKAFEGKWAHDAELRFKVEARRNRALGLWVAAQKGLTGQRRIGQLAQILFGSVQQTRLEEVQCQSMPGPVAVFVAQVRSGQQVLMHTYRALEISSSTEQIAQSEMQFRGVGVLLNGLNEGVYGLILLFVEQMIQTLEIGLGLGAVLYTQLAQVQSRGEPTQTKGQR